MAPRSRRVALFLMMPSLAVPSALLWIERSGASDTVSGLVVGALIGVGVAGAIWARRCSAA